MTLQDSRTDARTRRRFLQVVCVASVGGIAGCLGETDDDGAGDEPTDDESTDDEPTDDGDSTEYPSLRDVLTLDPSYVMELDGPLGTGTVVVHDGDTLTTWSVEGMEMEVYRIGTDAYIVVGDDCYRPVGTSEDEIFDPDELLAAHGDVRPAETSTIDGRDVYRFEVDDGALYVDTESGYPVRFVDQDGAGLIDFHSWGETEPISAPDMECLEQ